MLGIMGGLWFVTMDKKEVAPVADTATSMGIYQYTCTNGEGMAMEPAGDMSTIEVTLHEAPMTLSKVPGVGARYEGSGMTFVGAGEEVTISINGTTMTCAPVPSSDMAPFNWGDAAEGGGVKQDTSLIVSESILGAWQSTQDAKFAREFKAGGVVVDTYVGEAKTEGVWVAFTKENAPKQIAFPIEDDAVYVHITMKGSQADTLTFKVAKLTPETLELIYMERGGTLVFSRVN